MLGRLLVMVAAGGLCLPAAPASAHAQAAVAVFPLEGLRFGQLEPGITADVRPTTVGSRAVIELTGSGQVVVTFALPDYLESPRGFRVPLGFDASDGIWSFKGTGAQIRFDPRLPLEINIPRPRGGAFLYLGGMAHPAAQQPAGEYTATVTVQIFAPGT